MDSRVSGYQVEASEALQEHVTGRISAMTDRYFARAVAAKVTSGKGLHDNGFNCDIVAPVAKGVFAPPGRGARTGEPADPGGDAHRYFRNKCWRRGDDVGPSQNTNALMFRNSKTGESNMVYRRDDGTIG